MFANWLQGHLPLPTTQAVGSNTRTTCQALFQSHEQFLALAIFIRLSEVTGFVLLCPTWRQLNLSNSPHLQGGACNCCSRCQVRYCRFQHWCLLKLPHRPYHSIHTLWTHSTNSPRTFGALMECPEWGSTWISCVQTFLEVECTAQESGTPAGSLPTSKLWPALYKD